jgi:hypothetical protein
MSMHKTDQEEKGTTNGVPASDATADMDISRHAKVLGVERLVRARVCQDGLGVNARLVRESAETRNVVVEGDLDLARFGDNVFEVTKGMQLVFTLDILGVDNHHACY